MKSLIELQKYKKHIVSLLVGLLCNILGYIIYVIDPVDIIIHANLAMTPNSIIFKLWEKPPVDIFVRVYVFNITNADAFMSGDDHNLKLQEVGPYVFQEFLENRNITWNDNGTISYIPNRTIAFKPELSVGDYNDDFVTVVNTPMLGVFSALHDSGFFVNYPFVKLTNFLDSQPILHMSVKDYLMGYEDSLISLAGTVVPNWIDFKQFGLLDRMYDEGINVINMNIKGNENMTDENNRYLSIESVNGNPGLSNWGYVQVEGNETRSENSKCNTVRGATEGTVFPSYLDEKTIFRVYRISFCHPVPIVFDKKERVFGLETYRYTIPENFADPPDMNPENDCICLNKQSCLKRGLIEVSPCYYSIPTAVSLPHFLRADPTLSNRIEGLNPDSKKHDSEIFIHSTSGIPMYVHSRIQTNLLMRETYYNSKITPFNGLTVPLMWYELVIESWPFGYILLSHIADYVGPISQLLIVILLAVGGLITICWSSVRILLIFQEEQQRQKAIDFERRDSADLRIPLDYGQHTAIRIIPSSIKKITSKTDLFL